MPYTPPTSQSPALTRSSSYCDDAAAPRSPTLVRPGAPPRSNSSTAYMSKHRRSPSIKSDGAPPTPTEVPESGVHTTDFAPSESLHDSSTGLHMISQRGMPSPPESSDSSDGDEHAVRGRELANSWDELQKAVQGISQRRESSPEKPGAAVRGKPAAPAATSASAPTSETASPTALSAEARKISHSRSSTEVYIPPRATFESPNHTSDDSDEDNSNNSLRPALVRKKSGELVKPALRPSSRRRYSSMPGTPTYSKTVHFNDSDNQTRHFLQVDKPIAVSAGTSPVEQFEGETDFPFEGEREIKLSNFPVDTVTRQASPIRVERIFLSSDKQTLIGVCMAQNIAFHKAVVARFTLDYWKTTSEVAAEYNNDPKNAPGNGCDRFNFHIKLSDQANIEDKTLLLCVRYNVGGQEFWDNNNNANYQIDFTRAVRQPSKSTMTSGLGARPLNAIPRSRHSPPASARGRQESLDDDFAVRPDRESAYSRSSAQSLLGDTPNAIKLKARKRGSLFPSATDPAPGNGLGGRYDFGASLSAALSQAQEKISRQTAHAKAEHVHLGPVERKERPTKAEERPDAITTDRPAMGSDQYKDLVQKFCYVGSAGKPSPTPTQA